MAGASDGNTVCMKGGQPRVSKGGTSVLERRPEKESQRKKGIKRERVLCGSFQQLASDS
jgi:hypothetical protein